MGQYCVRRFPSRLVGVAVSLAALLIVVGVGLPVSAGERFPTYPSGTRTGITRIDRVLEAVDAGDAGRLEQLVRYRKVRCVRGERPGQIPAPPRCRPDEPTGSAVEVLLVGSCEGFYLRKERVVASTLRPFLTSQDGLYAVYRVPAEGRHSPFEPRDGFGLVYTEDVPGFVLGTAILVGPRGRITAILSGCSDNPRQFLAHRAGELVLPPRGGK